MAIVVNSFTPSGTTVYKTAGSTLTMTVDATETTSLAIAYQWQKKESGTTTWNNITGATSATYTTPALTAANDDGDAYRVRLSASGQTTVYGPSTNGIVVDTVVTTVIVFPVNLEPSYSVNTGQTLVMTVDATYSPAETAQQDILSTLNLQWQYRVLSTDDWQNVTSVTPVESIVLADTSGAYVKRSTISFSNASAALNLNQFRVVASNDLPSTNTPQSSDTTTVFINATITIDEQPGGAGDIITCERYSPLVANSGNLSFSVDASSSGAQYSTLQYQWYFAVYSSATPTPTYGPIVDGQGVYFTAAGGNSSTLTLSSVSFIETVLPLTSTSYGLKVYCAVGGSIGEPVVNTDIVSATVTQTISMTTAPVAVTTVEDLYGDIPDRNTYSTPINNASFTAQVNASSTTTNGNITMQWQRKNPGSSTWNNLTSAVQQTSSTYTTPPLKRTVDDGAYYRVQITAPNATNVPFYSPDANGVLLSVYRYIFLSSQPTSSSVYINQAASFGVIAGVSTSGVDPTYQWQVSTNNGSSWTNLTNTGIYSGTTTNLLVLSSVTTAYNNYAYRVVVNAPDTLNSVTSSSATLTVLSDSFTSISSIDDQALYVGNALSFTVTAQSSSLGTILYQWQKSSNGSTNWTNISGATSNTYTNSSVATTDTGYYRLQLTSSGGTVSFSNVAYVSVVELSITVTSSYPSSIKILEGEFPASGVANDSLSFPYTFTVSATPSISTNVSYQWQYSENGGTSYNNYITGYDGSSATSTSFIPPIFSRAQSGIKIRCQVYDNTGTIPTVFYSTVCTVTVDRRYYYNAGPATLSQQTNNQINLSLNDYVTGGTPTYQWQRSTNYNSSTGTGTWSNLSGETGNVLSILASSVTTAINGYAYRCLVTVDNVTSFEYFRNTLTIQNISPAGTATATAVIVLSITTADLKKAQYSELSTRTGAAIGTVICIPKPGTYTNGQSGDDTTSWITQVSGTSQAMYDSRFPGFVPLGYHTASSKVAASGSQLLDASHCPELARIMGNEFGGTINASYTTEGFLPPKTSPTATPVSGTFAIPNVCGKKLMGTGNTNNNGASASVVPRYDSKGSTGGTTNTVGSTGGQYNYVKLDQLPPENQGGQSGGQAGVSGGLAPSTFTLGTFTTSGWDQTTTDVPASYTESLTWTVGSISGATLGTATIHSHNANSFSVLQTAESAWSTSLVGVNSNCRTVGGADGVFLGGPAMTSAGNEATNKANTNFAHTHGVSISDASAEGTGHGTNRGGVGSDSVGDTINEIDTGSTVNNGQAVLSTQSNNIWNSNLKFTLQNNEMLAINQKYFRMKFMIKAW